MIKQKYKYKNGYIAGVEGEEDFKVINFDRFNINVIITKTINDSYGESYFNIYFIDDNFRLEPLNNLNENIPLENEPKNWEEYLIRRILEYLLWREFNYNVFIKDVEDNNT